MSNKAMHILVNEGIKADIDKHKYKSQPWTKEVVFKVYCNDDLNKLPLEILKQMRSYLDTIIENKAI